MSTEKAAGFPAAFGASFRFWLQILAHTLGSHGSVGSEGHGELHGVGIAELVQPVQEPVRLVNAGEYHLDSFECLRGFISGLYAGNYDISHVYVDNLCKIVHSEDFTAVEKFLCWLDKFSDANTVKFTVTLTADASVATDGMRKYL